eukprot:322215-Prymnesium_polylepis.2
MDAPMIHSHRRGLSLVQHLHVLQHSGFYPEAWGLSQNEFSIMCTRVSTVRRTTVQRSARLGDSGSTVSI